MPWVADLHIHSHFSMATSKQCDPVNLHHWAALKGVSLVGTGDFTHPGWRKELREQLIPAEPGFYRMKETPPCEIPGQPEVRFVITGELSTIYKKNGRTRKVHHLVVLPSLEAADGIGARLEALGMNIRSDGRPILGLDSRILLDIVLSVAPDAIFIPAHIWTPHFSVFGSNSGFDSLSECYEDLSSEIFALETGLSSDPAMNWQWSALDRFRLVSNSDAHNPRNLAREANLFTGEFSYQGLRKSLKGEINDGFVGTYEFFPEEGKYHLDGHRNCEICFEPSESRKHGLICPVCGRKITVGVLHRLTDLADRPAGVKPENARDFMSLVPLREIIGAALHVGAMTQKTERIYNDLLHNLGPELDILTMSDLNAVADRAGALVATGILRLRERKVNIKPGYDGEYGVISLFDEAERRSISGQKALFSMAQTTASIRKSPEIITSARSLSKRTEKEDKKEPKREKEGPSAEQEAVIHSTASTLSVIAGPGAGKTRTLVERIAALIRKRCILPSEITAVTFTNKAAAEIRTRLEKVLGEDSHFHELHVGTFHSLAWRIYCQQPEGPGDKLIDATEAESLIAEVLQEEKLSFSKREALGRIGLMKNKLGYEDDQAFTKEDHCLYRTYQRKLEAFGRLDFDDIIIKAVELWEQSPEWLEPFRTQFHYLLVDEFQDVSPAQYRLIKLWAQDCIGLTLIGDPNQAIYGFRGSDSIFFEKVSCDFPDNVRLRLADNYRSVAPLVHAANIFIPSELKQRPTVSDEGGEGVTWIKAPTERNCAKAVVTEITRLLGGASMVATDGQGGKKRAEISTAPSYGFGDFAILYRTARQASALEEALEAAGFPYRVVGGTDTLEAESVRACLDFCRFSSQPEDPYLLRIALIQGEWGLDDTESAWVSQWLASTSNPSSGYLKGLEEAAQEPLQSKLLRFAARDAKMRPLCDARPEQWIAAWMEQADMREMMELDHLARISENFQTLREMLAFLPMAMEADLSRKSKHAAQEEMITLSTIHAAKGLEYPIVFLTGVEEGILPLSKAIRAGEENEEQRLFYVALTRAKERFYALSSQFRFKGGAATAVEPSRFMQMLPEQWVKMVEFRERSRDKQLELFSV